MKDEKKVTKAEEAKNEDNDVELTDEQLAQVVGGITISNGFNNLRG